MNPSGSPLKLGIVIGRFQPVHLGHMRDVLVPAFVESDHVLVLLGSSNRAPDVKNPFSPDQRRAIILEAMVGAGYPEARDASPSKLQFRELDDFLYSDQRWLSEVQRLVSEYRNALRIAYEAPVEVTLYGVAKDRSSYYLNLFPQWKQALGSKRDPRNLSGTAVRTRLFEGDDAWKEFVPPGSVQWLEEWIGTDEGIRISGEWTFLKKYREPFEAFARDKYPIIMNTVDAVVYNRGRVLMVRRRAHPGKDLWALPGGFLRVKETLLDGAIRECREETKLRLRRDWLVTRGVYDFPGRSLRGRVITNAFLFRLPDFIEEGQMDIASAVENVEGGTDAAHAGWIPFHSLVHEDEFRRSVYEDHIDIVVDLVGRLSDAS